jgi:hypothetical protein
VGSVSIQVEVNEAEVNDDDEGSEGGQAHGDMKGSVAIQWSDHHGQMWRGGNPVSFTAKPGCSSSITSLLCSSTILASSFFPWRPPTVSRILLALSGQVQDLTRGMASATAHSAYKC